MKNKILTLMLALTMIFTLAACGEKASLTLEKTEITLTEEGATADLTAATTGKKVETVTFKSSDESIATVDANGKVTAVAKGTATITASAVAGKETLTATATVKCEWADPVDLAEFYNSMFPDPSNAPAVMDLAAEPDMLNGFYPGMADIETKQCVVYMPMMTAVPFEIALVEVANAADVDTVKEIMKTRIDNEIANFMNYPMVTENWEKNSRIVSNGNYVMMVAYEDYEGFIEAFNALF